MKKMRIALINPPAVKNADFIREGRCMQSSDSWATIWPPLTLATLAAIARKYAEVQLFDCIAEKTDIMRMVDTLKQFQPEIIMLAAAFPSIEGDRKAAAQIKKAFPGSILIGFGAFFTLLKKESLIYCSEFDGAIMGEPETTFEEFLQARISDLNIAGIKGLMWRKDKDIEMGPERGLIENLDNLPYPARDLLKNHLYILPDTGEPFTLINSARGCSYQCIFCIAPLYYGKKTRRHSIEYIVREIEICQKDFGLHNFLFWEEVFTADKEFCEKLLGEFIKRKLNIKWAATTRADSLNRDILLKMKESGCMLLGLGIESGNQEILNRAKKKEDVNQIKKSVLLCKEIGIPVMGHFIFGLPGETKSTAEQTIKFSLTLGLDYIQCYCAVPYPGTELSDMALRNNWLISHSWNDYDFGGKSILNIGTLQSREIDQIKKTAFHKFYFRWKYILKQIRYLKTPGRVLNALNFLKWMGGF